MGPMAVPVCWVPPSHPTFAGSGAVCPQGRGHQDRRVWQEQAKPGYGSILTGESSGFAIPVPGLGVREGPGSAHPGREQQERGSPGQCPGNSPAHVLGSITCSLISVMPLEREFPKPRHFQDILVSVSKGE